MPGHDGSRVDRARELPNSRFNFQTATALTVIASEAKQSISQHKERMDCFVAPLLAMTARHDFAISPRLSREFCFVFLPLKIRGRREAGCPMHPQPRVQNKNSTRASHYRFTGVTRSSLRNGLRLIRALPGVRLSNAHIFVAEIAGD
jgi:hypothetical protein